MQTTSTRRIRSATGGETNKVEEGFNRYREKTRVQRGGRGGIVVVVFFVAFVIFHSICTYSDPSTVIVYTLLSLRRATDVYPVHFVSRGERNFHRILPYPKFKQSR